MAKEFWLRFFNPKKQKYTILYYRKHGITSAIDNFRLPAKYKGNKELLYKECILQGKRWEQIVDKIPKDAIL